MRRRKPKAPKAKTLAVQASESGEAPHMWLLRVMRGAPVNCMELRLVPDGHGRAVEKYVEVERFPTFAERLDAARIAAPFFAPKLSNAVVREEALDARMKTDAELEAELASLARELSKGGG